MSIEEIKQAFGGRIVGNNYVKQMVHLAVSKLPNETAKQITKNCWFLSSDEDTFGYAFDGNDLKDKHLIFLSEILFHEEESQILYTILHEIGHVALKHRNSIGMKQTKEEISLQELEADQFAKINLAFKD
jgi:hypothetical protein